MATTAERNIADMSTALGEELEKLKTQNSKIKQMYLDAVEKHVNALKEIQALSGVITKLETENSEAKAQSDSEKFAMQQRLDSLVICEQNALKEIQKLSSVITQLETQNSEAKAQSDSEKFAMQQRLDSLVISEQKNVEKVESLTDLIGKFQIEIGDLKKRNERMKSLSKLNEELELANADLKTHIAQSDSEKFAMQQRLDSFVSSEQKNVEKVESLTELIGKFQTEIGDLKKRNEEMKSLSKLNEELELANADLKTHIAQSDSEKFAMQQRLDSFVSSEQKNVEKVESLTELIGKFQTEIGDLKKRNEEMKSLSKLNEELELANADLKTHIAQSDSEKFAMQQRLDSLVSSEQKNVEKVESLTELIGKFQTEIGDLKKRNEEMKSLSKLNEELELANADLKTHIAQSDSEKFAMQQRLDSLVSKDLRNTEKVDSLGDIIAKLRVENSDLKKAVTASEDEIEGLKIAVGCNNGELSAIQEQIKTSARQEQKAVEKLKSISKVNDELQGANAELKKMVNESKKGQASLQAKLDASTNKAQKAFEEVKSLTSLVEDLHHQNNDLKKTMMGLFSKKKKKDHKEMDEDEQLALAIALSYQADADASNPGSSAARAIQEDEELAKAIALSKLEAAEERDKPKVGQSHNNPSRISSISTVSDCSPSDTGLFNNGTVCADTTVDPDLARYLSKDYWLEKQYQPKSEPEETAPGPSTTAQSWVARPLLKEETPVFKEVPKPPVRSLGEATVLSLEGSVARMEARIRRTLARGRSVGTDVEIHRMFTELMQAYNSQVIKRMSELEAERDHYEQLQDRVDSIIEARQAVDALREDYAREKKERELAEERELQRKIQEKLTAMRVKKQEMLNQQRQEVLKKIHESRATNTQLFGYVAPEQPSVRMPETPSTSVFRQEPVAPSLSLDSLFFKDSPEISRVPDVKREPTQNATGEH
ncbi:hypothetical protein QR680_012217 [Steinernema hermaphroditum]|uniref:Hepatocyte growth factor-regulated tyrosine kinase substrate helical domain-containing protein n=1 Tax=Steinernema hermaphroditum TaxID=289476 RepID=A0AA39I1C0_9BILA|nr:hypothetical protein QR680_012217 [Steinernema hermaphroditum]